MPPNLAIVGLLGRVEKRSTAAGASNDLGMVRLICGHHNWVGLAYVHFLIYYNQLIATSHMGEIGIWNAVTRHWQTQDGVLINSRDTAGSFLLLGCHNGFIHYVEVQKFPLRMKDNDLLAIELYHDPMEDAVAALSVHLMPKSSKGLLASTMTNKCSSRRWFQMPASCTCASPLLGRGYARSAQLTAHPSWPSWSSSARAPAASAPCHYLLTGHSNGSLQLWDLTTAMEMGGPTPSCKG